MTAPDSPNWGFDARWSDYEDDDARPEGTLGLPQVIAALAADLRTAAAAAAENGESTLRFKDASITLDVALTVSGEAKAEVKFWVFTGASAGGSIERARTTSITLNLDPVGEGPVLGVR